MSYILHLLSFDSVLITSCTWLWFTALSSQTTLGSFSLFASQKEGRRATELPDSITGLSDTSLWLFEMMQEEDESVSSVQLLSRVQLFATPWTTACQASLSITNSQSSHKPMSTESVMPSNHFILCRPLLLLPSIFPSIRVFSSESVLHIRWSNYWSFSFSKVLPMNI